MRSIDLEYKKIVFKIYLTRGSRSRQLVKTSISYKDFTIYLGSQSLSSYQKQTSTYKLMSWRLSQNRVTKNSPKKNVNPKLEQIRSL